MTTPTLTLAELLDHFTARDLGDALYQADQPTGGNKPEKVARLTALSLPPERLLDLFVVDALRDACLAADVPANGKKADLIASLLSRLRTPLSLAAQVSHQVIGAFRNAFSSNPPRSTAEQPPSGPQQSTAQQILASQSVRTPAVYQASSHPLAQPYQATPPQATYGQPQANYPVASLRPLAAPQQAYATPAYTTHATGSDPVMREVLLTFLIDTSTPEDLSKWLRELDANPRGTVDEKRLRIRQNTQFFSCSTNELVRRVVGDLRRSGIGPAVNLCERFGLSIDGSKGALLRRIHRYIAAREGQVPWIAPTGRLPTMQEVCSMVDWYPLYQPRDQEREHYGEFAETMREIFGANLVHMGAAVAHGIHLKVDFHIGNLMHEGIGVEFKMPANNSDVQKALGQVGQYQTRYRESLIVVVFPHRIESKTLVPFLHELKRMNVTSIVKNCWDEA